MIALDRRTRRTLLLLALLIAPTLGLSADELWDRALDAVGYNRNWFAGEVVVTTEEFNGAGRRLSHEIARMRNVITDDREVVQEPIRVFRNDEDITRQRIENPNYGRPFGDIGIGGDAFRGLELAPLDPRHGERVSMTATNNSRIIEGRRARGFAFEHRTYGRFRNVGTIWLDEEHGAPILIEGRVMPNPAFVSRLEYRQRFDIDEDGDFRAVEFFVDADGGFLFIRRRFVVHLAFSEFRRVDGGF